MVIVVAAMFVTSEYRRGLIRTTFTAIPAGDADLAGQKPGHRRVSFVLSAAVMAVAVPLGQHLLRSHGNYVYSASTLTQARIAHRGQRRDRHRRDHRHRAVRARPRPAAAIAAGVGVILVPFIVASAAGGGIAAWLLRLTPAAGMSMLQALTQYHQVSYAYTITNGYYPLAPLAGLAVLCGYALLAFTAAAVLLNRRDA